ncbi:hypothetical protein FRB90_008411 [Tulasnella sp. 427]|nr:hypothetical protein FRB90_008411 [Tulasnella sp. 427]
MSLNQDEILILEKVINIRNRLTALKQKPEFVKTQDVLNIYQQMVKQDAVLTQLHDSLSVLSDDLIPIHQRLVALRRQLVALAAKPKPSKTDLKPLVEELRKIDQ